MRTSALFSDSEASSVLDGYFFSLTANRYLEDRIFNSILSEEEIAFIYELKTCALLEASMMIGAILGGASEEELALVERMARNIGMAFQIQDDILDITGDEEKLGKLRNIKSHLSKF